MSFVQVRCSDGAEFDLSMDEIACSKVLKAMTEDQLVVTKINLDMITSSVMANIHKFMKLTVNSPGEWIDSFMEECAQELTPLLQASHFLEIDSLTEAIAEFIAKQIQQHGSIASMRDTFGIVNDLTPEEEAAAKMQVLWALDDIDK